MSDRTIPYGRQTIETDDVQAVTRALTADFITTGPEVAAFEADLSHATGAPYAAVLNSGTSAIHAAYAALGVGAGDEIITSPITFAATGNAALYLGARPIFVDVEPTTALIDPRYVEEAITPRTKAIVAIDYAGQPADYAALRAVAQRHGIALVADAAHSLGASDGGHRVGTLADATILSFHPVKAITTGEGGAVLTDSAGLHSAVQSFRSHGMVHDRSRLSRDEGPWYMEMQSLGFNYRMTDVQCALGRSQLRKLPSFLSRRQAIAAAYDDGLATVPGIELPGRRDGALSAWHLYVVRVTDPSKRRRFFEALRARGIGVQVHYLPVYRHPFYEGLGYRKGLCPNAEAFYERAVSLPIFPTLDEADVRRVIDTVVSISDTILA